MTAWKNGCGGGLEQRQRLRGSQARPTASNGLRNSAGQAALVICSLNVMQLFIAIANDMALLSVAMSTRLPAKRHLQGTSPAAHSIEPRPSDGEFEYWVVGFLHCCRRRIGKGPQYEACGCAVELAQPPNPHRASRARKTKNLSQAGSTSRNPASGRLGSAI
jgi:hypothetical protein